MDSRFEGSRIPVHCIGCRIAAATVALGVSGALIVGLLGLFDGASTVPWLTNTPENVDRIKACDGIQGTTARDICTRRIVTGVLASHDKRLAFINPQDAASSP